jgi:hypothetical protein
MKRLEPRISVNKLGEYMVATASRRRTIRADQKDAMAFKAARYKEATHAILKYLADQNQDIRIIETAIRKLRSNVTSSSFQEQERKLNIEALASFLLISDKVNLRSYSRKLVHKSAETIKVAGVTVTVNPYIVFSANEKSSAPKLGMLKLHFPKSHPLVEESATYVGAIMLHHCQQTHSRLGTPDHRLFNIIDVSTREVFPAPQRTKKRLIEIEAACEEIVAGW